MPKITIEGAKIVVTQMFREVITDAVYDSIHPFLNSTSIAWILFRELEEREDHKSDDEGDGHTSSDDEQSIPVIDEQSKPIPVIDEQPKANTKPPIPLIYPATDDRLSVQIVSEGLYYEPKTKICLKFVDDETVGLEV